MIDIHPTLASRLQAAREALGLSKAEMAKHLGVHPSMISKVERGATGDSAPTLFSVPVLVSAADTLGTLTDWLTGRTQSGAPRPVDLLLASGRARYVGGEKS